MAGTLPLSSSITPALSRCGLAFGTVGLWETRLLGAVQDYRTSCALDEEMAALGAAHVAQYLARFHRSLNRTANMRSAAKHWAGLSDAGRVFVEMRLRLADPPRAGFASLDLTDPSDLAVLRDAVGAARRWLGEKPGTEHGPAIRAFVGEVARVYQHATGRGPGLSSSETTAGSQYSTPFEDLLLAVLAVAGRPLSLEGARGLYRSALRGKPKKARE